MYGNYALLFESFHILTDLLVTVAVFAAIRLSYSNYSKKYSYGLYRVEDLASLAIAVVIAFTAIDLLISVPSSSSTSDLQSGILQLVSILPLYFSGVVKIIGGKSVKSPALVSDGYHNYSDVYVGLGVGAGLLVSFATGVGAFYYVAIVIAAGGILYTSFKIGRESVTGIMDLPKDKRVIPKIAEIVNSNDQVTDVRSIKARWAGPVIFVEIVITVNSKLTIEEAHDVSNDIEKNVLGGISDVKDVVVHIEPSKNPERVVMVPASEPDKIARMTARSVEYVIFTISKGITTSTKSIHIPLQEISPEGNAKRILSIARQNLVTDTIVVNAGEVLFSLFKVNHIDVWRAQTDSIRDNLGLLLMNKLESVTVDHQ